MTLYAFDYEKNKSTTLISAIHQCIDSSKVGFISSCCLIPHKLRTEINIL